MTGLIGAWIAAVIMGWLGEAKGKRGSALIAMLGFLSAASVVLFFVRFESLIALSITKDAPLATPYYAMLSSPEGSMLLGAVLVLAVFGPFVVMIEAAAKPAPPSPSAETWRTPPARREPEV